MHSNAEKDDVGFRDAYRIRFLLGTLGVVACLAALFFGGPMGAAIALLPLGFGGVISAIIAFFTYIGWREEELDADRGTLTPASRYELAALCTPLAIFWLGGWVYGLYADAYETRTWSFLLFAFPLWVILIRSIVGLTGGMDQLLGNGKHAKRSVLGDLAALLVTVAMVGGLVYVFVFHEGKYVAEHRKKCESLGQTLEKRANAIGSGTHYACSSDPRPRYRY